MRLPLIPSGDHFVERYAEFREAVRNMHRLGDLPSVRQGEISEHELSDTREVMIDCVLVSVHGNNCAEQSGTFHPLTLAGLEFTFALRPALHWVAGYPDAIERITGRRIIGPSRGERSI